MLTPQDLPGTIGKGALGCPDFLLAHLSVNAIKGTLRELRTLWDWDPGLAAINALNRPWPLTVDP